ncbi:neurofibromin-like isoform X2 [Pongo pygmaeus]|uniref:neurofibromin-like isoform X2 n=1 Tax=Pongo pygmaeus TaxID=9600 RepID=UPI00300D63DC
MIDCLVSCFRISPHNNQHFKICLAQNSPSTFHYVLVNSLHQIITNLALDWWPKIDAVYYHSVELRNMFGETLHKAVQGCGAHPAIRMAPDKSLGKIKGKYCLDPSYSTAVITRFPMMAPQLGIQSPRRSGSNFLLSLLVIYRKKTIQQFNRKMNKGQKTQRRNTNVQ